MYILGLMLIGIFFHKYYINNNHYNAQRLVAQALGRARFVAGILAGIPKLHSNVHLRSLGQVACSHVLGVFKTAEANHQLYLLQFYCRYSLLIQ